MYTFSIFCIPPPSQVILVRRTLGYYHVTTRMCWKAVRESEKKTTPEYVVQPDFFCARLFCFRFCFCFSSAGSSLFRHSKQI